VKRRLGAHVSVAGSLLNALHQARHIGANTIQIFTASPRSWRPAPLDPAQVDAFRAARLRLDIQPLVIHNSYLINLASADAAIREKSIAAMRAEFLRAIALDADFLVAHPGSAKGQSPSAAIALLQAGIAAATHNLPPSRLTLLWEITAGQGDSLGASLDQLLEIRHRTATAIPLPTAFCLDTAHAFAAGIDFSTAVAALSPSLLPVIHLNDSKAPFASRLDRHQHIGKGYIGEEAFRRYLNHPGLSTQAFILETPEDDDGDHARNLETLKRLCRKSPITPRRSNPAG
jgi:deoxyribonuclease-4